MHERSVRYRQGRNRFGCFPAIAAIVGAILMAIIPGCTCDEGEGCHGCGPLNGMSAFLMLGGFVGALAALISILPGSLLLAGVFTLFSRSKSAPIEDQ